MSTADTNDAPAVAGYSLPQPSRRRIIAWLLVSLLATGGMWLAVLAFQRWVARVNSGPPHRIPKNAPFMVSPQDVVDRMLELAELDENDVVYDLGCGDGRIVITAAKRYGCRGIGFEYDAKIADLARQNVNEQGVADLVTIQQRDIFTIEPAELNRATAITLYLLPWMNDKLKPRLAQLKTGKVIVSHDWDLPGYEPDRVERMESQDDHVNYEHRILVWRTPLTKK
jgi:SAM-dependent methyltransferase